MYESEVDQGKIEVVPVPVGTDAVGGVRKKEGNEWATGANVDVGSGSGGRGGNVDPVREMRKWGTGDRGSAADEEHVDDDGSDDEDVEGLEESLHALGAIMGYMSDEDVGDEDGEETGEWEGGGPEVDDEEEVDGGKEEIGDVISQSAAMDIDLAKAV